MKAILTKSLPYTNHRPRRIKVYAEGVKPMILSWEACTQRGENDETAHLHAAVVFAISMKWSTDLIGGGTPEGYCFVFADSRINSRRAAS